MKDLITNDPPAKENLDVVLIRNGVNEMTATPEDYRRVPCYTTGPLAAMTSDDVVKVAAEGYTVLFTAAPGVATGPEVMARQRSLEGAPIDRSKL